MYYKKYRADDCQRGLSLCWRRSLNQTDLTLGQVVIDLAVVGNRQTGTVFGDVLGVNTAGIMGFIAAIQCNISIPRKEQTVEGAAGSTLTVHFNAACHRNQIHRGSGSTSDGSTAQINVAVNDQVDRICIVIEVVTPNLQIAGNIDIQAIGTNRSIFSSRD